MLLRREREFRARVWTDGAIDVKPGVHHAHFDEPIEPLFGEQVVDVRLAEARANAGHYAVLQAVFDALHRLAPHAAAAAALVGNDFVAFDAHERRDVAHAAHPGRHFVGDELSVGKDLEVAVGMLFENVEQLGVHERLAAQDAEEGVAHRLGFVDHPVHRGGVDRLLLGGHVDPAPLAAEVAAIDDRHVQEGRKELAPPQPRLVFLHRAHSLETHVPSQLPQ